MVVFVSVLAGIAIEVAAVGLAMLLEIALSIIVLTVPPMGQWRLGIRLTPALKGILRARWFRYVRWTVGIVVALSVASLLCANYLFLDTA